MEQLKHSLTVVEKDGVLSCGGSQLWMEDRNLRKCGCGAVAMAELALYLCRYHGCGGPKEAGLDPIPAADYERLVSSLQKRYLLLIPPFGITGLTLADGVSRYCREHRIPLRAFWGVRKKNLWQTIGQLLRRDLPVILSVGPNVPFAGSDNHSAARQKMLGGMESDTPISDEADFVRRVKNGEMRPFRRENVAL